MDRDTLLALAARVEAAAGADRALDAEIATKLGWRQQWQGMWWPAWLIAEARRRKQSPFSLGKQPVELPAYTASLDAAAALVPAGWHGQVGIGVGVAALHHAERETADSEAPTPALALTAAALRARAEEVRRSHPPHDGKDPPGMTEIPASSLFIVITEDSAPGQIFTSETEASAAAAETASAALPLDFVLGWWAAANLTCLALEVLQEPSGAQAERDARQAVLARRLAEWRRCMGSTDASGEVMVPEPAPAQGSPAGEALARAIEEYLAVLQNNVVASQVKAVEVATLRGVTREKVNVASQLKALARLVASAASQAPQPNVVISAFATLCVHELVAISLRRPDAGVTGHA